MCVFDWWRIDLSSDRTLVISAYIYVARGAIIPHVMDGVASWALLDWKKVNKAILFKRTQHTESSSYGKLLEISDKGFTRH